VDHDSENSFLRDCFFNHFLNDGQIYEYGSNFTKRVNEVKYSFFLNLLLVIYISMFPAK
jgi:hypothetical protein